jgi:hypothetical protein
MRLSRCCEGTAPKREEHEDCEGKGHGDSPAGQADGDPRGAVAQEQLSLYPVEPPARTAPRSQ